MFFRARGDEEAADYWSRQCTRADYALPGVGVDCSWNYGPCLRAARGDWPAVREALDHYWAHGAGNEFNSPLYGGRVYVAAALSALGAGGHAAWSFFHRFTGFLALQATLAPPPRRGQTFLWAGETKRMRPLRTGSGVAIPSTGMRTNGAALRNPVIEPVLAHVLGIEHEMRQPRHWRDWRAPRNKEEWGHRGSPPSPFAYVETVRQAETRSGARIREQPFMKFCARAVRGDMEVWRELARAVEGACVPLPRGIVRFVIERRPDAVATFWEGTSPTRQKPSVPAGAIVGNRRHILIPATWQIPSTQTRSRITDTEVRTQADETDIMPRLEGPAATFELT